MESLKKFSVAELRELAAESIDLRAITAKKDIISAILSKRTNEGCLFSSVEHLVDITKERLTVLNVYIACEKFGLSMSEGMELWLKTKKKHIDPIWKGPATDQRRFLVAADTALTGICQKPRKYKEREDNFIKFLLRGVCNCSCGSQLLLALKESYNLNKIGFALFEGHIAIVYHNKNTLMVYETTDGDFEWMTYEKFNEEHEVQQKLEAILFSDTSLTIYPLVERVVELETYDKGSDFMKKLFLASPRYFWNLTIFQDFWDLYNPESKETTKQLKILEELKNFAETKIDASDIFSIFLLTCYVSVVDIEIRKFASKISDEIFQLIKHNRNVKSSKQLQYFKREGRISAYSVSFTFKFHYSQARSTIIHRQ